MANYVYDDKGMYNGWKNHATWNIALWIGNQQDWYVTAAFSNDYDDFQKLIGVAKTPDGVLLEDGDYDELTECILELHDGKYSS